jgi:uncharacterized protein (DUF2267 family)
MSASGLDVFDTTLRATDTTTPIWLDQIAARIGPDRALAWRVLGAVLPAVRDRLPPEPAACLGTQMPLLARGLYYDRWEPFQAPLKPGSRAEFLADVAQGLADIRPVNIAKAVHAVLGVLDHHADPAQVRKVREALPRDVRDLWPETAREGRGARSAA